MKLLFESLSERKRPEDIAERILELLRADLNSGERALLERAAKCSLRRQVWAYSSMLQDFARPKGMSVQVERARIIFASAYELSADECTDPVKVEAFLRHIQPEIHKAFGRSDFKHDRLNRGARSLAGLEISRRRYNRKFRMLARMEAKLRKLIRELKKLELTLIGKSRLASRLDWASFCASPNSACFVAYFTARCNLRSEFTVSGQQRPFDEIAQMLLRRCARDESTSWWAVAHVYSTTEVLGHLSEGQKGRLLSRWFDVLQDVATLLREVWQSSNIDRRTMIVRRGNDSSTWNNTASAWNAAREHWISMLHAMGLDSLLDCLCPGKVLRLMAADVVMWHKSVGNGLSPDTAVWNELPLPWEVLSGARRCGRSHVESVCRRHGVDPIAGGWTAPRAARVATYRPTPELVHGVCVKDAGLATVLRKAGWFSGKANKIVVRSPGDLYEQVIGAHRDDKEKELNDKQRCG